MLFTADEYKRLAGHPYNSVTDHVSVANGDWSAMEAHVGGSIYGGGNVYVSLSRQAPKNGSLRIDYAIIIAAYAAT